MKKLLYALVIAISLSSCDNKEDTIRHCDYSDPLEDLEWLKEFKETLTDCDIQISIFQASYNKQTVFFSMITDPLVNSVFGAILWNCEGDVVRSFDYDESEKFQELVTDMVVLYRCKNDSEVL